MQNFRLLLVTQYTLGVPSKNVRFLCSERRRGNEWTLPHGEMPVWNSKWAKAWCRNEQTCGGQLDVMYVPLRIWGKLQGILWGSDPSHVINVDLHMTGFLHIFSISTQLFQGGLPLPFWRWERKTEVPASSTVSGSLLVTVCLSYVLRELVPKGCSPCLPTPKPGLCLHQATFLLLLCWWPIHLQHILSHS